MLNFNSNGLLIPDNNIQSNITELEKAFVKDIPTTKRRELFDKYVSYSIALKEICNNADLKQWIDGSFVTKKPHPGDIDLVTFIDFSTIDALNDKLTNYKYPAAQNVFGVDAYIIRTYPVDHKRYLIYKADWI